MENQIRDSSLFIFPDVWKKFMKLIEKRKNVLLYEFQLNTGCRFKEGLHIRPIDFDFERNNVRLWKTKTKARKGEKVGKPRTISISSEFSRKMKRFCNNKPPQEYLWNVSQAGYNQLLKKKLEKIGVKNAEQFSSHDIRRTHGMYLKALGIDMAEICTRLGHDYDTYIKHYGSADVFSERDMTQIRELLGSLYMRRRMY